MKLKRRFLSPRSPPSLEIYLFTRGAAVDSLTTNRRTGLPDRLLSGWCGKSEGFSRESVRPRKSNGAGEQFLNNPQFQRHPHYFCWEKRAKNTCVLT